MRRYLRRSLDEREC